MDENRSEVTSAEVPADVAANGMDAFPVTPTEDLFDGRLRRIEQFRQQSLWQEDAFTAVLGAITADVMHAELHVGQAVLQWLGATPASLEELDKNRLSIEMLVKLSRQVAQFAKLQRKSGKAAA